MPRPRYLYDVYEGDELIFSGTATQVVNELDMKTSTVSSYAKTGTLIYGKYRVEQSKEVIKYELKDKDGRIVFIGTSKEIGEKYDCNTRWISNYADHHMKLFGLYTVTAFVDLTRVANKKVHKTKTMSRLEQDYPELKRTLLENGNLSYPENVKDELVQMLKNDGIDCYYVPSSIFKKGVVLYLL